MSQTKKSVSFTVKRFSFYEVRKAMVGAVDAGVPDTAVVWMQPDHAEGGAVAFRWSERG